MWLHRERDSSGFTAADVAILTQLMPHLAVGLRTALLRNDMEAAPREDGPGIVLLHEVLTIAALSPPAERLLVEIGHWPRSESMPQAISAVANPLKALGEGNDHDNDTRGAPALLP